MIWSYLFDVWGRKAFVTSFFGDVFLSWLDSGSYCINVCAFSLIFQFVKFANIEEDTPSYHRSYDFFVSRFSEMCHSGYEDPDIRTKWDNTIRPKLFLIMIDHCCPSETTFLHINHYYKSPFMCVTRFCRYLTNKKCSSTLKTQ